MRASAAVVDLIRAGLEGRGDDPQVILALVDPDFAARPIGESSQVPGVKPFV
jgi:hypothetical protein